ncbi:Stk1 family PASTA domain-containing Ser/Thr kinase [Janibacter hoylei]|uniref:Stk1 family PASTA domain-containing Ser/Thr kinase n=1 Tax=Janibacter hoylei TaxID=364298 RepID=UPI000689362B|nr:Stk1 family PASTA domain-containing Ser/Thr kinase [Janibacter hoylei]
MPEVSGQTSEDAQALLTRYELSPTEQAAFDEQVPQGDVITTTPPVGTELSKGADVTIVVSKGPERYEVPDLGGRTASQATADLEAEHLGVGRTTRAYDADVPKGQVVSSSPAAGTELKRDATVDIVVSRGPQPIVVPGVTGTTAEAATTKIEGAGLKVSRGDDAYSTTVPKGSVISQSPASGTLLPGETVTITVSKGPEMVAVPEVEGLNRSAATKKLQDAGFTVSVQTFLGGPLDEVRASRPSGGTAPQGLDGHDPRRLITRPAG